MSFNNAEVRLYSITKIGSPRFSKSGCTPSPGPLGNVIRPLGNISEPPPWMVPVRTVLYELKSVDVNSNLLGTVLAN